MNRSRTTPENGARRPFWIIFALTFLILLPFASNGFISDDWALIWHVASKGLLGVWSLPPDDFFRPLISISLWLGYEIGGWHSWALAVPNYLLHAANTGFVYQIARAMLQRINPEIAPATRSSVAALAALVFMAAPSHAEGVFFMSCRTDLLAAFFGLSAVCVFLSAIEGKSVRMIASALALLTAGYLCKESVFLLFAFFAVVAVIQRNDKDRSRLAWLSSAGAFVLLLAVLAIRSRVVTAALPYEMGVHGPAGIAKAAARMAIMFIRPAIPVDVGVVQGKPLPQLSGLDWAALVFLVVIVGFAAVRLICPTKDQTRMPSLWAPLAGFVVTDVTVCFLTMPAFSVEGSRLLYLPSTFSAIVLAFLVSPTLSRPIVRTGVIAFVLCGVWFTYFNGTLYRDAGKICRDAIDWFQSHDPGPDPAVILLPDSIGGRYVWRNGFDGATAVFAPKWERTPRIVIPYVDGLQVWDAIHSGNFDFRLIAKGNAVRSGIDPMTAQFAHAAVIVEWPNGSADRIDGANVRF